MLGLVPVPGVVMPFTLNMHQPKDINSWVLWMLNSLVHWVRRCGASPMCWISWNHQLSKTQCVVLGWAQLGCQHLVHLRCPEVPEALHGVASYHTGPAWHPHSTGELVRVPGGTPWRIPMARNACVWEQGWNSQVRFHPREGSPAFYTKDTLTELTRSLLT